MPFTPFLVAISFSIMFNSSCLRIKILSHTSQAYHVPSDRIALKMIFGISWCKNMATCETNCFLFYKDSDECGDFKGEGELVPLSECNADISAHLRRCHLSKERRC